jgi:hypothetical protein
LEREDTPVTIREDAVTNPSNLAVPLTSSASVGTDVPIPTLKPLTTNTS